MRACFLGMLLLFCYMRTESFSTRQKENVKSRHLKTCLINNEIILSELCNPFIGTDRHTHQNQLLIDS